MAIDEGNGGFSNQSINCTKLSDNEHLELIRRSQIAVPIIFGLILIFGIIGNGSVVWIVLRSKQMRTIPNIYIVSLALGDLLLILIAVPFSVFIYMFDEWYFGVTLCKVNFFMETFSLGISVFTLTLLSIDRYLAISYPMQKRSGASVKKTVCRASSVWVMSSCLAIPDVLSSGVIQSPCLTYCGPYQVNWGQWYVKFHVTYRFVLYFAIPILIIGVCYCLMAKALLCNDSGVLVEVTTNRHNVSRAHASRTQVAKLVLSFVVVFAVCWLPRHVFLLVTHYGLFDFNQFWYVFKIVGFCLAFTNSCVNPLALYLQSEQFWKYFCAYFCRCCFGNTVRSHRQGKPSSGHYHYVKTPSAQTNTTCIEMYQK